MQISAWTGFTGTTNAANANGTAAAKVEGSLGTLFTVGTTGPTTPIYTFAPGGNPSSIANTTIAGGVVTLASGKTLDYETATSYVFIIV